MGTTDGIGDGIDFPEVGDNMTPLEPWFATLAQSAQDEVDLVAKGSAIRVPSQAARDALYPSPSGYEVVFRNDMGWEETYFPEGVLYTGTAGWYPTDGRMPTVATGITATQNINNGAWSSLAINATATINHGGGTFPNSTTFNVPVPGMYSVFYSAQFAGNNSGTIRGIRTIFDGTNIVEEQRRGSPSASSYQFSASRIGPIATTLVVQAYQDSGGTLGISNRNLFVRYMGPI